MLRSCVVLSAVVLSALLLVGGIAGSVRGIDAFLAASVAASVCWLGSLIALLIVALSIRSGHAVHAHLLGMIFRFGLPLGVGTTLQKMGGRLADGGVFG